MSLPNKLIVFLGRTFSGHNHDYNMLKQEFPPELDWFADIHVGVDLGYQGIQADYSGDQIDIPTKKPRKSKKHPNPQLSAEQKAANTVLSQVRIFIEHAIGVCAGLWNLALSYYCHFPDLKPRQIAFSELRLGDEYTTPTHPYSC